MSELNEFSKSLSFKADVPEIAFLNTQKKHSRARSASSPVRPVLASTRVASDVAIAPAADNQDTAIPPDMVMDTFMNGLDKWNGIFRNAMVSEFMVARKSLLAYQSELDKKEKCRLQDRIKELESHVALLNSNVISMKSQLAGREALLDATLNHLQKRKHQTILALTYANWKSRALTSTRNKLADHMATIHYHATTMRKVMHGWRGVVGNTWRIATEKRIRAEAEKCMLEMAQDYENQIENLNRKLEETLAKLEDAEQQKGLQQDEMKRALMRGVCALNMEAMAVFRENGMPSSTIKPTVKDQQSLVTEEAPPDDFFDALLIPKQMEPKPVKNVKFKQDSKPARTPVSRIVITRHQ